jgi:tRNA threonylcarbamoyladenosine biosynthesis protein TsaE
MSEKTLTASTIEDLAGVARKILDEMNEQRVFALKGLMGAGKTTLIKAFCDVLGVESMVSSPTFALVNEYTDKDALPIYHFDFYRIKKIEEVFDIGYEEYLYGDNYCFLEWPELIEGLLPDDYVNVDIEVGANEERIITYRMSASS